MNTGKENRTAASTDNRSTGIFGRITMREIMGIMAFLTPSGLVPPYVMDICIEEEKSGAQEFRKLEEAVAVSVVSEYAAKCAGLPKKAH